MPAANNGNPTQHTITDGSTTRTQNFAYDAANRVSEACEANVGSTSCSFHLGSPPWTGNGFEQAYGYDQYNNQWVDPNGTVPLLTLMPTSSSAFDATKNRFHTTNFGGTYDAAGRMTAQSSVSSSITRADEKWDADGQRVESKYTYSSSENTNTMSYDALGNRVRKFNPSVGETIYVYDALGNLAAEYGAGATTACSPCYLVHDPVGSVRLVVDQNQAVVKRYDTMPFGEQISAGSGWANGRTGSEYQAPGTVKWRFAGSYKDDQAGEWPENVMGVRQFNPGYGRFVTPDDNLVDQHPGDPLSWNLFGYARNNPLRFSDPSGRTCVAIVDGAGKTSGYHDIEGPGGTCNDANSPTKNNTPTVTVTGKQSSLLAYLSAPPVPRYVPNDRPLDEKGQVISQELSKKIDNYPDVCAVGITVRFGRENSWLSAGFDLNTSKGLRPAGGVRIGDSPGIGQASASIKGLDIKGSFQIPTPTGLNIGVSSSNFHSISGLTVGRRIRGVVNFQVGADIGTVAQCGKQ